MTVVLPEDGMTVFLIRPEDAARLKAAALRASTKVIPWEQLSHYLTPNQQTGTLTLAEREVTPVNRTQHVESVRLPFDWRVAISCEQQPAGVLLHLSMSSPRKGRVPRQEALQMVVEACGYTMDDVVRFWLEEFDPGHFAPNVLIMLKATT